jgi:uncharacterized protein
MVDITPLVPAGRQVIQGYGDGGFRIAGETHSGSVLVLRDETLPWAVTEISDISVESLSAILAPGTTVEILLIGCGATPAPLEGALRRLLEDRGIAAEIMDTGAACRTFNVLLAEDRAVAAALIAVS